MNDEECYRCTSERHNYDLVGCLGCRARFRIAMRNKENLDCVFVRRDPETGIAEIQEEAIE